MREGEREGERQMIAGSRRVMTSRYDSPAGYLKERERVFQRSAFLHHWYLV